ncbi:helix-turn-helix domain-containing protein [Bacillus sp. AK128]
MTELGQHLKQAREEKNISLEELQGITKIQRRYLQHIEEGNYDGLPGLFYARAFVKQYAEAVGLDSERVFEEFKDELPSAKNEAIPEQLSRVKKARADVNTKDSKFLQFFPRILVTVILIGIAFTVWTVFQNRLPTDQVEESPETETGAEVEENAENPLQTASSESEESEEDLEETEEEAVEEEEEVVEPVQQFELIESSGRNFTYKLTNTDQFIVDVSTTGETWLILENGKNKNFFSGMLNTIEGDQSPDRTTYDYSNETEAYIKLGKAVDSVLVINGQTIELPAEPTGVQEITVLFEKSNE